MKKTAVKIISFILVLTMMFSFQLMSALAQEESSIPTVFVDGIVAEDIVKFNDDGTFSKVFPPTADTALNAVKKVADKTVQSIENKVKPKEAFGDILVAAANAVFENLGCDNTGTPSDDTGIPIDNLVPRYSENERGYHFTYDWRLSPFEIAEQLNTYIENVKELTGSEKVNIIAFSMGGIMFTTYLSVYGSDDINSAVLNSVAILGTSVAGEPISGKVNLAGEMLVQYIDAIMGDSYLNNFIIDFAQLLHSTYALHITVEALEKLLFEYEDKIYEEVLFTSFATLPGIWSLMPDGNYQDAKTALFDGKYDEYFALIELNDRYHYDIQQNAKSILEEAMNDGVKIGVISKYNKPLTPVLESFNVQSDLVIDTRYTSLGAVCAPLNETLGEDYVQQRYNDVNYISPDRIIDASTCWFPQYTWFIRDMGHDDFGDDFYSLINYIFNAEVAVTVFDSEEFPQFLQYNQNTTEITPLESTESPMYVIGNFFEIIIRIIERLIELFFYVLGE